MKEDRAIFLLHPVLLHPTREHSLAQMQLTQPLMGATPQQWISNGGSESWRRRHTSLLV